MAEFGANDGILGFLFKKSGRFEEISKSDIHNVRLNYFPDEIYENPIIKKKKMDFREESRKLQRERIYTYLYGYPKHNYCKKFKLEDDIEEIDTFNKKYNSEKLRWVMWKENDKTKDFINSIKRRIINESNIIIVIYGTPNSGKSEVSQTIAKYISYLFEKLRNRRITTHIAFSTGEFDIILREMKTGDIAIRDESPELSGIGARTANKNLDNITKIVRMNQNSFIFVNPVEMKVDVVSFYLEMAGKCEKERISRCILKDKNGDFVGHIYVPLHNDEDLRQEYLRKKKENIEILLNNSGQVNAIYNDGRFKKDKEKLINICKENESFTKSDIDLEIFKMGNEITGDTNYKTNLLTAVYKEMKKLKRGMRIEREGFEIEKTNKIKMNNNKIIVDELDLITPEENSEEEIDLDFKISEEEILNVIRKEVNWHKIERDIEIYKERKKGIFLEDLSKEYGVDFSTISTIAGKVKGAVNFYKGKLFEKKYYEYLKSLKRYDKVIQDGDSGKPDIYAYDEENSSIHIFSLKYYETEERPFQIGVKDMKSELKFAYDNSFTYDDVFLKLIFYDSLTGKVIEKEVDFRNPENIRID